MQTKIYNQHIVRLILQFLEENHYNSSVSTLQKESNIYLNVIPNLENFNQNFLNGKWEEVLKVTRNLQLDNEISMQLHELILLELIEIKEFAAASYLFQNLIKKSDLYQRFKERSMRIEYLIRQLSGNLLEIYTDGLSKQERRQKVLNEVINQTQIVSSGRLLTLLGQALQFQHSMGWNQSQNYDIFTGTDIEKNQKSQIPSSILNRVNYPLDSRTVCATFSNDLKNIVLGQLDGIIEVYNTKGQIRQDLEYQRLSKFMIHEHSISLLQFSVDDQLLISTDTTNQIKLWKFNAGKMLKKIKSPIDKLKDVYLSEQQQLILVGSQNIGIYGIQSGSLLKQNNSFQKHGNITCSFYNTENEYLYIGTSDCVIHQLNADLQLLKTISLRDTNVQSGRVESIQKIILHKQQIFTLFNFGNISIHNLDSNTTQEINQEAVSNSLEMNLTKQGIHILHSNIIQSFNFCQEEIGRVQLEAQGTGMICSDTMIVVWHENGVTAFYH